MVFFERKKRWKKEGRRGGVEKRSNSGKKGVVGRQLRQLRR